MALRTWARCRRRQMRWRRSAIRHRAHPPCAFNVDAKDNSFGEAVAPFQEFSNFLRDALTPFLHYKVLIEVGAVVNAVFDQIPVLILESFRRAPALRIDVQSDLNDLVGREEAVVDTLQTTPSGLASTPGSVLTRRQQPRHFSKIIADSCT